MSEPDPAFRMFHWQPNWQLLSLQIAISAGLVGLGFGLGVAAEWMCSVSHWLIVLAVFMWILAALLMVIGLMILFLLMPMYLLIYISKLSSIISIHREAVWISESPQVDLIPKTVVINYDTIAWVKRERFSRKRDSILIVHGPELKTEHVAEIRQTDVEEILAILAERCPAAFKPDPPDGWRPLKP